MQKEGDLLSVTGMHERSVYQPLSMGVRPMGQPLPRKKIKHSRKTYLSAKKFPHVNYTEVKRSSHAAVHPEGSSPNILAEIGRLLKRRRSTASPSAAGIPSRPLLLPLKTFPVAAGLMVFFILFGAGFFDSVILTSRAVSFDVFPGGVEPSVSINRASIEIPLVDNPSSELVFTRHRVVRGETLSRISYKYGLSPSTLISVNDLKAPDDVKNGRILIIPYIDGIRAAASPGESPEDLALRFGTTADMVQLIPGSSDYFISGGSSLESTPASFTRDVFLYPVSGRILTGFGESIDSLTGIGFESEGLDLYAAEGTLVKASRGGTVILTGNHSSYGLYVMMSHAGGWKSFYGHLSRVDVAPGDKIESGTSLGLTGRSGTARSPRLYFALIRNDKSVDPLDYLY